MLTGQLRILFLSLCLASSGTALSATTGNPAPATASEADARSVQPAEAQVSINQDSAEMLAGAMKGVGLKKARSIVEYREKYGPFTSVEQLTEVPGMSTSLVERNLSRLKL